MAGCGCVDLCLLYGVLPMGLFVCLYEQVMASVWSVTPMFGRVLWCVSVMSATTAHIRVAVSSVVDPASLMLTTAKSARSLKRM